MMRRILLLSLLAVSACHRHRRQVVIVPPPPPPSPQPSTPPAQVRHPASPAPPPRRMATPPVPSQPTAPAPAPSTPAPVLIPSISPEQREASLQSIQLYSQRAQAVLARAGRVALTASQQAAVARIQSFLQQAQLSRATDVAAAQSFAERADALAQDLAKSLP